MSKSEASDDDAPKPLIQLEDMIRRTEEIRSVWDRVDTNAIGRVLRAQLLVEHYVNEHFETHHPKVAKMSAAKLNTWQKTRLIDPTVPFAKDLVPGIDALRELRNKFAHELNYQVTDQDIKTFSKSSFFADFYKTYNEQNGITHPTPTDAVEAFGLFASMWLHHGSFISEKLAEEERRYAEEKHRLAIEAARLQAQRELLNEMRDELGDEDDSALGE